MSGDDRRLQVANQSELAAALNAVPAATLRELTVRVGIAYDVLLTGSCLAYPHVPAKYQEHLSAALDALQTLDEQLHADYGTDRVTPPRL